MLLEMPVRMYVEDTESLLPVGGATFQVIKVIVAEATERLAFNGFILPVQDLGIFLDVVRMAIENVDPKVVHHPGGVVLASEESVVEVRFPYPIQLPLRMAPNPLDLPAPQVQQVGQVD